MGDAEHLQFAPKTCRDGHRAVESRSPMSEPAGGAMVADFAPRRWREIYATSRRRTRAHRPGTPS
jgi:hypothetical protein